MYQLQCNSADGMNYTWQHIKIRRFNDFTEKVVRLAQCTTCGRYFLLGMINLLLPLVNWSTCMFRSSDTVSVFKAESCRWLVHNNWTKLYRISKAQRPIIGTSRVPTSRFQLWNVSNSSWTGVENLGQIFVLFLWNLGERGTRKMYRLKSSSSA